MTDTDIPHDGRENPVKTIELDHDDAHTALVTDTKYDRIHMAIEGYATLYKRLWTLQSALNKYDEEAEEVGADELLEDLAGKRAKIRQTVLDDHDHPLRWTLDAYDELPEDPEEVEE